MDWKKNQSASENYLNQKEVRVKMDQITNSTPIVSIPTKLPKYPHTQSMSI